MKVLVTGATGFIGSHAADALERAGHDVIGLSRSRPGSAGLRQNRRWVFGDLRRPKGVPHRSVRADAVVHCAGRLPGVDAPPAPDATSAAETRGAITIAIGAGADRFVHVSSLAVCDPPNPNGVLDERSALSERPPSWHYYARSKIAEERAVRGAHDRGSISAVILRPGIAFGPGDRHATPLFLRMLAAPVGFYVGNGNNAVASLVVEELAEAVARAATRGGIDGRCYPLAGRARVTQRDLFRMHARERGAFRPRACLPRWLALRVVDWMDRFGHAGGRRNSSVTRIGAWIVGTASPVDCGAAAADLDWKGDRSVADAIARSIGAIAEGRP